MSDALTIGGFVALLGLMITTIALAVGLTRSNAKIGERIARLEERLRLQDHERRDQ